MPENNTTNPLLFLVAAAALLGGAALLFFLQGDPDDEASPDDLSAQDEEASVAATPPPPACEDPEDCYLRALRVLESSTALADSFDEVVHLLEGACHGGIGAACQDRAVLADEGIGAPGDPDTAARFFSLACDLGHEPGCIGARQADLDLSQDPESWLRRCLEEENLNDCVQYGLFLSRGGDPQAPDHSAQDFLQRACDAGMPDGCFWWARHLEGLDEGDDTRQQELFAQACEGGMARACTTLARRLDVGLATSDDPAPPTPQLIDLTSQGCDLGDGYACHHLGVLHLRAGDPDAALDAFRRGCDLWHGESCDALARRLLETDRDEAAPYLERACQLGVTASCFNYAIYLNVSGDPPPFDRSRRLLESACDDAHPGACFYAAQMIRNGQGGPADPARASRLVQQACDLGFAPACQPQ